MAIILGCQKDKDTVFLLLILFIGNDGIELSAEYSCGLIPVSLL